MSNHTKSYAIIGAGISGAACAFHMQQKGYNVDVFDKGRKVGGRFSTYQEAGLQFDYGSTIINTYPSNFLPILHQWYDDNLVKEYQGRVSYYSDQDQFKTLDHCEFYVAKDASSSIIKYLLENSKCHLSTRIQSINLEVDGWWLKGSYYDHQEKKAGHWGPYDEIIFALPGPQFAPLILSHRLDWGKAALKTKYMPQWSVSYVFSEKLETDFDLLFYTKESPFKLLSRESCKYEQNQEVWTVQMQYNWSSQYIDYAKDQMSDLVLSLLQAEYPSISTPIKSKAHLWRYAYPVIPHSEKSFLHDSQRGLSVCGDWLSGGCIGLAYMCGHELALHLTK